MDWQLVVASVIVVAAVVRIAVAAVRRIRRGDGGCSCGCDGCSLSDACSDKKKKK